MKLIDIMKKRCSYRNTFTDKKVSLDEMRLILEAGYTAPSGCNLQTCKFIGVLDSEKVKAIADIYGHEWANTAPACIVIVTQPLVKSGKGCSRYLEDFGAAAQNILLQIVELGYATTWIQGQIEGDKAREIGKILNVDSEYTVIGYFPVGEPACELKYVKKQDFNERCFIDSM